MAFNIYVRNIVYTEPVFPLNFYVVSSVKLQLSPSSRERISPSWSISYAKAMGQRPAQFLSKAVNEGKNQDEKREKGKKRGIKLLWNFSMKN